MVDLNEELRKEVVPPKNWHTDGSKRSLQEEFPFSDSGSERVNVAVMDRQAIAGMDRILLALLKIDS